MKTSNHVIPKLQKYFLLGMLLVLLVSLLLFASPFLTTLFVAGIIVTAIHPIHVFINKKLKVTESLSALLVLLIITALILGPATIIFFAIAGQASDAYIAINRHIQDLIASNYNILSLFDTSPVLQSWVEKLLTYNPISPDQILSITRGLVGNISKLILSNATGIFRNLTIWALHAVVFLGALFFFVRDGDRLVEYIRSLLPLKEKHRKEVIAGMYRFTQSIMYGIFGAAIAQGLLLWVGLAFFGIKHAIFWSAVGAVLALLPAGITLIWIPVALALFFNHQITQAIVFTLWCVGVVSLADNFVKPYVIGVKSMLNPFAVVVMILGGFFMFGFAGVIFGPFIFMLTMTFLKIYKEEYQDLLNEDK
ncbi:AI-2E family transporter [Candidatus Gracilibacteria bacterium]|nr:AI-2E family transporter [Candidatus Gracilibacteria bacterium]